MRLIDADAFERRCMFDSNIEDMQDVIYALRDYSTVPAIPIPEGATNGDVIKALFPRIKIKKFPTFLRVIEGEEYIPMTYDWWNAPYKRGELK